MIEAACNIARAAPARRVTDQDHADEASVSTETFNRFRDGVDETVAREREFAAEGLRANGSPTFVGTGL